MKITVFSLVAEVPPDQLDAVEALLAELRNKPGVVITKQDKRVLSDELRELGLPTQLNKGLTGLDLDTVDQLCACTPAELLTKQGVVGYASLRTIILALAALTPPRHLEGHLIPPNDLVEHLPTNSVATYQRLKEAGLDSISQLVAQDVVALERIVPDNVIDLLRALHLRELAPAPLGRDRTLGDLQVAEESGLVDVLHEAGYNSSSRMASITRDGLRAELRVRAGVADDMLEYWVYRFARLLQYYGSDL